MSEALRVLLIVGGTLVGLAICSIPLVGGAMIDRANRARMIQLGYDGSLEERQDARIAGYEQEYVNGTLDLDGLDRAVAGVLGMLPPEPPPKPSDARRSVTPVLLEPAEPATPGWRLKEQYRTDSLAWSATASVPASAVGPAPPREVVELVDGSGRHVAYVDVTPRGRPPLHHVRQHRQEGAP